MPAGRRATQVALQVHSGRVQQVFKTHGFIEWQPSKDNKESKEAPSLARVFFNAFDVEASLVLRVGDEVTFTIADKVQYPLHRIGHI